MGLAINIRIWIIGAMESMIDSLVTKLATHRGRWPVLAEVSGVPISTLRKIAQGVVKNPRVDTVDKLLQALTSLAEEAPPQ